MQRWEIGCALTRNTWVWTTNLSQFLHSLPGSALRLWQEKHLDSVTHTEYSIDGAYAATVPIEVICRYFFDRAPTEFAPRWRECTMDGSSQKPGSGTKRVDGSLPNHEFPLVLTCRSPSGCPGGWTVRRGTYACDGPPRLPLALHDPLLRCALPTMLKRVDRNLPSQGASHLIRAHFDLG